jgi:hypothetical protein
METRIDFLRWLSNKLYLTNVAMYVTVGLSMLLPFFLTSAFALPQIGASFVAFLIISLTRAFYESLVIYETKFKQLSLEKLLILSIATAIVMAAILSYLRASLGNFAIPVAVIIARMVVGKLKAALWPATTRPGFFALLPAKLKLSMTGSYYFFGILVGLTYVAYGKYGFNFEYIFPVAFFIGMIAEELYLAINVYEIKPEGKTIIWLVAWAAICALLSTAIVIVMMSVFGYTGQAATIASVILVKLIQPLGARKIINNA